MVLFFAMMGVMIVLVPPYLQTWLAGYSWLPTPLPMIASYLLMVLILAVFLGIFAIIFFSVNRKRGGGP